jgi:hypothetical protein
MGSTNTPDEVHHLPEVGKEQIAPTSSVVVPSEVLANRTAVVEVLRPYDPHLLVSLGQDFTGFSATSSIIQELTSDTSLSESGETQASHAISKMRGVATRLISEGPQRILMGLYGNFCRTHGVEKTLGTMRIPKPMNELDEGELSRWNEYLETAQISREDAVRILNSNLLSLFDLPSVKYLDSEAARHIYIELYRAECQLVLMILPDITDEEAKQLFGQLTPADRVREIATGREVKQVELK